MWFSEKQIIGVLKGADAGVIMHRRLLAADGLKDISFRICDSRFKVAMSNVVPMRVVFPVARGCLSDVLI